MFTARNAIVAAVVVTVVAILFNVLMILGSPDSDGRALDSFGTRWNGFRGVFELLGESGVTVQRRIGPPEADLPAATTFVVLVPDAEIVATEPAYLERMLNWVEAGGRIVAAPVFAPERRSHTSKRKTGKAATLLDVLGIKGVAVEQQQETYHEQDDSDSLPARERRRRIREAMRQAWKQTWEPQEFTFLTVTTKVTGKFPLDSQRVAQLYLPADAERHLVLDKPKEASGLLDVRAMAGDKPRTLAASFRRGKGEIIVVAEPALFMNVCLAHDDNAVLAYDLLADGGRRVVFDEFYHGLSVRGDPFWLLTQRQYAVGALAALAFASLVIWRRAVVLGPPLEIVPPSRRTILEYVEAMARFFQAARGSRLFVLSEVRGGALRTLGDRLGLSPGESTPENVASALARRSPADARRFEAAVTQLNAAQDRGQACSEQEALRALQGISACL